MMQKINSYTKKIGNRRIKVIRTKRIKQTINNTKDRSNSLIVNNNKFTRREDNINSHNPALRKNIKDLNRIK